MDKVEFKLRKELIELELSAKVEAMKFQHDIKKDEIEAERRSKESFEKYKHELELERQRIRNADIQRTKLIR
jgi:hypothetical protein